MHTANLALPGSSRTGKHGTGKSPQLFNHKLGLPQWCSEHEDSLLVDGQVCTPSPDGGMGVIHLSYSDEWLTTHGENSSSIPQLCLPQIHLNPGVLPQIVLERSVNGGDSVWSAYNVDVVQKGKQLLAGVQIFRNCNQCTMLPQREQDINGSPCSPPSPWEMS